MGSGCSTDILSGQTTPRGSGLPRSSPHANRAGLQETSYIHCFKLLQGVPGSENQTEMLQMLGRAWSQRKYSLRCLQQTMRKVGNTLKAAQLMQKSRVRQGLSEYHPFLHIQKYQSETVGRLTEQCRMRCQESVDNTWLSTSFTLWASNARCQHRARNHSAPRQRASGCHSTWTVSREGEFNWVFLFWDTQRCTWTY